MSRHNSHARIYTGFMANAHASRESLVNLIKDEPMFFRADPAFAKLHGDLLTHDFLRAAERIWGNLDGCIIDSRHHMLMPAMVPCIPGWHTDDAPRSSDYCGGQPNIFDPEYVTEHLLCVVDAGTGSLTEFLLGPVDAPQQMVESAYGARGTTFYKTMDTLIETGYAGRDCERVHPASGDIVSFDSHSWHRGVPAKSRGFRFFIRITRNSRHKVENEIRSNAQVYITDTSYGW